MTTSITILKTDDLFSNYKTFIVYPNGSRTCIHGSQSLLDSNKWIISSYGKKVIKSFLSK